MTKLSEETHVRVVVVGAGLSGVAAAVRLEKAGITDFVVLEKSSGVGGTWRNNTYPGCGVDIPSPVYSFSFNPNPGWTSNFARQPEILSYVEETAEKFGVMKYIELETEMIEASWSNERRRWILETSRGTYVAQHAIFAAGPITEPKIPSLPGLESFTGEVFHSATWNHDLDLRGKRVAVIGTGASAVQFVPEIQPVVEQLHVFQRTASWVIPRTDFPFPAPVRFAFRRAPVTQALLRQAADSILRTLSTVMRHEAVARRLLNPLGLAYLRRQVSDPVLRKALTPDFTVGCKRLMLSNDYYAALAQPNVELIPQGLVALDETGVVAADGTRRDVDVVIFGTGFDVSHPPIASRIRLRDGSLLADRWSHSPEAYLATSTPDAPNAWIMLGPNILVYNSFLGLAEAQLTYIIDMLNETEKSGVEVVEIKYDVYRSFNDDVQEALQGSVFNNGGCSSYYLDDQGRNFSAWPWTTGTLRRRLSRFEAEKYDATSYAD